MTSSTEISIREWAELFGLPFPWALQRRIGFLEETSGMIVNQVQRLLGLRAECNEVERILLDGEIDFWLKKFQKFHLMLVDLKYPHRKKPQGITPAMVERAREFPIENLIEEMPSRSGMAHCIFHEDRVASVSIKKGKYHCFSCGASHDPISFVMATRGLDFIEAVKALNSE